MGSLKYQIALAAALGLGAITEEACAQRIGMFFDPEATTCSKQIGLYEEGKIWIIAFVDDPSVSIVGLEFGIDGLPRTWSLVFAGSTDSDTYFSDAGRSIIVGYRQPLQGAGNRITLGWIYYFSASVVPATTLRLAAGSRSNDDTPILIQRSDDSECAGVSTFRYFVIPATGSMAVINGECSIAVESKSWGMIKELYR